MRTYIESLFGIDQRYIMLMVDLKGMMIGTSCCCCFSASSSENELGGMTLEEYDVISEIRNGKHSSRKWSDFRFGSTKYCTQIRYTCDKFHVEVNHKQRPQQNDPTATATRRVRVQGTVSQ